MSLCKDLEHRLLQLGLRQKLLETRISLSVLLQLSQTPDVLILDTAVLLMPEMMSRVRHLNDAADLDDALALGDGCSAVLSLRMICCDE